MTNRPVNYEIFFKLRNKKFLKNFKSYVFISENGSADPNQFTSIYQAGKTYFLEDLTLIYPILQDFIKHYYIRI